MPSRFEKYRVKDGVTPLGERFLNPVFQDIDLRLAGLEDLRLSWEAAVRAVSDYGLVRINDVLGPALLEVTDKSAQIEDKRLAAIAALAQLEATIAGIQSDTEANVDAWKVLLQADQEDALAGIATWKAARLAELDAWRTSLTAELPGIDGRLDALESGKADATAVGVALAEKADAAATATALAAKANQTDLASTQAKLPILVQPEDLGNLTIAAGVVDGQLAAVAGYGLYRYDSTSTETADGESILQPSAGGGRWYLAAPHWDFVWSYLAGLFDDLQGQVETAQSLVSGAVSTANAAAAAVAAKFDASKVLTGSASLDFASIAAGASAVLQIDVASAATTDRVVLTPPSALPNGLVPVAYVATAGKVDVRLNNVTAAAIDPAAMTYLVTVFKP